MPLYEYKCDKCGKVIEVRQRFSDEPLTVHDDCGGSLERLISMSAFQLKGSGWYATDYAKHSGAPPKNEGGSSTASTSDSKSETKTETKSDSKPAESKPATTEKSKSD